VIKYLLIPLGIVASAAAQLSLKKASYISHKELFFYVYLCTSGAFYVVSFGLYTIILKHFPMAKISPVMTLGTMALVVITGSLIFREIISVRQLIGIAIGAIAIILIVT
jgi:drug/metabolite transporter (DMT)-like permease